MILRDVLVSWPRLWQHPELFAALYNGAPEIADEVAVDSVLRALTSAPGAATAARVLLARGEWQGAEELLRAAPGEIVPELREEIRGEHSRWLSDVEVRVTSIQVRSAALGRDGELEALVRDATALRQETEATIAEADVALRAGEDAELAVLEDAAVSAAAERGWGSTRVSAVEACLRNRRISEARALIADDTLYGEAEKAWPARRESDVVGPPDAFARRPPWPWGGRDVKECIGWFSHHQGSVRPPGFGEKWLPPAGDLQAGPILALLEESAQTDDLEARTHTLARAVAIALEATVSKQGTAAVVTPDDERLRVFRPFDGAFTVESHTRRQANAGILLRSSEGPALVVTWGDLLGSVGAAGARRVHLLRSLVAQIPPREAERAALARWSSVPVAAYVGWRLDLHALIPEAGLTATAERLAAGRLDFAEPLIASWLHTASADGRATLATLQEAWRSRVFREEAARRLRECLATSREAETLLRLAAALDVESVLPDEAQTILALAAPDTTDAVAREATRTLAESDLASLKEGRIVIDGPMRRLVRHVLSIDL